MSNRTYAVSIVLLLATSWMAPACSYAAEVSDISSPTKRQETVDQAKRLLAVRAAAVVSVDPFHSEAFAEFVASTGHVVAPTGPVVARRTEREILEAIAASLKPSGNFNLGGQQTLVFGQKRVKAGGFLTITFEGTEYTLEVTAIERTNFTLRLNREEFTRPTK